MAAQKISLAAVAVYAGGPARDHAAARWPTNGKLHVTVGELRALRCNAVEVRRLRHRIPVTGQRVSPHFVGNEENYVRTRGERARFVFRFRVISRNIRGW